MDNSDDPRIVLRRLQRALIAISADLDAIQSRSPKALTPAIAETNRQAAGAAIQFDDTSVRHFALALAKSRHDVQ
jgi:hypothetical protein